MSLPSFPSTWTAPTSCFASTNYYRVLLGSGYFSNMYGTPTPVLTGIYPTGDCFPPSSTKNVPYVTDGDCPAGFTRACATAGPESRGKPVSTVTCCPSVTGNVFSFMCKDNEYGCHATATSGAVWTGLITDIGLATPTEEPVTRTPDLKEGIEAWGIKMISVAPKSSESTKTTTPLHRKTSSIVSTSTPTGQRGNDPGAPTSQSQLPTSAIVGIVIGSVVGVALLALAAYLLFRRKRKEPNRHELGGPPSSSKQVAEVSAVHQLDAQDPRPGAHPVWELQS